MSEEVEPYLLDRKRAAAFLGISGSTVRVWYEKGLMPEPEVKMPRKKYWSRESLKALREAQQQKPKRKSRSKKRKVEH